jgi:predicted hydrocarbon binding protein
MKTIHLQIQLLAPVEPEKPKSFWYKLGYEYGKVFAKPKKTKSIDNLFKDWSKDYSDLEKPAVLRKRK